MFTINFNFKIF